MQFHSFVINNIILFIIFSHTHTKTDLNFRQSKKNSEVPIFLSQKMIFILTFTNIFSFSGMKILHIIFKSKQSQVSPILLKENINRERYEFKFAKRIFFSS